MWQVIHVTVPITGMTDFKKLRGALKNMPTCSIIWSREIHWLKNQTKSPTEHNQINHRWLDMGGCSTEGTQRGSKIITEPAATTQPWAGASATTDEPCPCSHCLVPLSSSSSFTEAEETTCRARCYPPCRVALYFGCVERSVIYTLRRQLHWG